MDIGRKKVFCQKYTRSADYRQFHHSLNEIEYNYLKVIGQNFVFFSEGLSCHLKYIFQPKA